MCRQHPGATMTPRDAQLEELRLPPGRVVRTLYAPGSKVFLVEVISSERPVSRICIRQPTSKYYEQLGSPDEHTSYFGAVIPSGGRGVYFMTARLRAERQGQAFGVDYSGLGRSSLAGADAHL